MVRTLLAATTLAICVLSTRIALGADSAPTEVDPILYSHPSQLVAVEGGRRLNLLCLGTGSPTVILEGPYGGDSRMWRKVQANIASYTRACAYDRAGNGFSDPIDRPATAPNIVDDLHTLLGKAGVKPPIVLVGHSAGGLYATLYADLHLNEVAGMVLVDPSFAEQTKRNRAVSTPAERAGEKPSRDAGAALYRTCGDLARAGKTADMAAARCPQPPPGLAPALDASIRASYTSAKFYDMLLSEAAAFSPSPDEELSTDDRAEDAAARSFGAMPLIVLTAGKWPNAPTFTPQTNASLFQVWKDGHGRLAARSTRGRTILVDSGHTIEIEKPDVVIAAIREVVETARNDARSRR